MIKAQLGRWTPLQRFVPLRLRYVLVPAVLWLLVGLFFLGSRNGALRRASLHRFFTPHGHVHRMPPYRTIPRLVDRVPCLGPRRLPLHNSTDDELRPRELPGVAYPVPFLGSHRALGVDQTWMTADDRYGPYGFGEDKPTYGRSVVAWDEVDWADLQDRCSARNDFRFPTVPPSVRLRADARFAWRNRTTIKPTPSWDEFKSTRRTALVMRTWSNFDYKPENLWNIRSLIVEAALRTGGEYAVVLLVHVQDRDRNIFQSRASYDAAFEAAAIPPELQSIALLWDDHLLESWYESVSEHRTMWQANQPLQLFALHYPEFDHYWQLELDQRFLGDAGKYLDAVSDFARNEPRKQSLERSTFAYSDDFQTSYDDLIRQVDSANKGSSRTWGPVRVSEIDPIGPEPPVPRPEDDDFFWGVGEEADVIVTGACADVRGSSWVFAHYIKGFWKGTATPRWWCPPAVMRASRPLLLAVHQAQHDLGLELPSEATLPTWALWHGLKLSRPPQPAYMRPHEAERKDFGDDDTRDPARWLNTTTTPWFGHNPANSTDGMSHANPQSFADRGLTWWWVSEWPRNIMDVWLAGSTDDEKMPGMLQVRDGKVYVPNLAMHPAKT
ncbi:hypothetical protein RJ55_04048 [Drechmeria coniospora]|nr:hypothetical protein RJ55_04048 [Drechmeria coniospora]